MKFVMLGLGLGTCLAGIVVNILGKDYVGAIWAFTAGCYCATAVVYARRCDE